MTTDWHYLTMAAREQAAQHDVPHPTPVCPSSPEGAMPLQSATLSHKKSAIPHQGAIGAGHYPDTRTCVHCGAQARLGEECICRNDIVAGGAIGKGQYMPGHLTLDASKLLPEWKDLNLMPSKGWPPMVAAYDEPNLESHEGIPAEVVNGANILGSDMPATVLTKLEVQMKGKWVMVRLPPELVMGVDVGRNGDETCVVTRKGDRIISIESMPAPVDAREVEAMRWANSLRYPTLRINPNDFGFVLSWHIEHRTVRSVLVGVPTGDRALKRAGLTAYVGEDEELARAAAVEMHLEHGQAFLEGKPPEEMVNVCGEQRSVDEYCVATPVPCAVPSRAEALAMREMVEKAAEAMRGRGAAMPERSFLNAPRQHDSPLSARVVPASGAPDAKVGW